MSATTTVRVTEKHIAEGRPGNSCLCALALAVCEALSLEGVAVNVVSIGAPGGDMAHPYDGWRVQLGLYEGGGTKWLRAELSREAIDWIGLFDTAAPVKPIEVTLTWEPAQ